VTLYHWDLPLALAMQHNGWLDPSISDFFLHYADTCFKYFGDRVRHWITINEPWCVAVLGYDIGIHAPGRVVSPGVEVYVAGHNLILSHAKAVTLYRTKYKSSQNGTIGITLNCDWREPASTRSADIQAAERALQFFLAWFADPIYFGDYPQTMKDLVGSRLPSFTNDEKLLIRGTNDFFGLNHYTSWLTADQPVAGPPSWSNDQLTSSSQDPTWTITDNGWGITPWGIRKMLNWVSSRYNKPSIVITENGCACTPEPNTTSAVEDTVRVKFLQDYIFNAGLAIGDGVDLRGYFVWSLLDNFEWAEGYSKRFGIHRVDYDTQLRTPKGSAKWYSSVMRQNGLSLNNTV